MVAGRHPIHGSPGTPRPSGRAVGFPARVQRKRTRGWRMPPNTVYVGRPTVYGNSTSLDDYWDRGFSGSAHAARVWAVEQYRARLMAETLSAETFRIQVRRELRGRNLACWCPDGEPCHVDVLLEVANAD